MEAVKGARNIRIYDGLFSDEEIVSLHKSIDCLVSPHRSEGFGFNLAEAMYFGKPVIATRYSANLDYMNDANGYLIDCKLTPIRQTVGPYAKGAVGPIPRSIICAYLMRRVFENARGTRAQGSTGRAGDSHQLQRGGGRRDHGASGFRNWIWISPSHRPLCSGDTNCHARAACFARRDPPAVRAEIRGLVGQAGDQHHHAGLQRGWQRSCGPVSNRCGRSAIPSGNSACGTTLPPPRARCEVLAAYRGTDPRIKIVRGDRNLRNRRRFEPRSGDLHGRVPGVPR